MTLLTNDLVEWSRLQMPAERFFQGPDLPKYPGRMVVWSPAQGGGLATEWATDRPAFQAHVVGPQSRDGRVNASAKAAEELIYAVDRMVLIQTWPVTRVNGVYVVSSQRFGSGPTPLQQDNGGRSHFVATYIFECESGYA